MANTTSGRILRSEADWRAILSAFAASDLGQKAFCEREGLAVSTLQYWKRRLAKDAAEVEPGAGAQIIDLGALEQRPAGWEVEIALGDGVSVTLRRR